VLAKLSELALASVGGVSARGMVFGCQKGVECGNGGGGERERERAHVGLPVLQGSAEAVEVAADDKELP
jgi:hypothetical protein